LLDSAGEFRFRRDPAHRKSSGSRGPNKSATATADLPEADQTLFAALKKLRLEFARERGVPAYVIFRDRSLVDMAANKPANEAEFADVFGVGEAKLRDFALPFLALIDEFTDALEPPP